LDSDETKEKELSKVFDELEGLRRQKEKIEASYREVFPKVDPYLVHDLLMRIQDNPKKYSSSGPMYNIEVFTKEGIDSQKSRDHILATTGTVPAIFDKGTHYVTHMRITPEILKKLNDFDYVLEVMGEYSGSEASIGPLHDKGEVSKRRMMDDRRKSIS
jgi:hypothetical protein